VGSNVRINRVREILRATPDGMTVAQLAEAAGTDTSHVHRMIHRFPDAYIDRWLKAGQRCTAIWCVVVPPENCPRPERKK
jgi:predicted DNA-binding transcriptional regulator YafY